MRTPSADRRRFLQTSAALAAGMAATANVHAAGNELLKVGLIGCGSRGTGAAEQALKADPNVKLWAMSDAFSDRLQSSLTTLQNNPELAPKIDVPQERRFTGFDGFRQVIASCDVVLLCTPPQFRPLHLREAVRANRHVFAEKPCAVDAPGVRSVLETCREAAKKNLSVVSGLCLRSDPGFRDTAKRIHDGALGDIHTLQANDYRGGIWIRNREAGWSDMTWQMRNWYYFTWLSGDFNVEQHVHFLDVCAWVMGDRWPTKCIGMGGRAQRTGPEFGQIYDHFSIVYEFANGAKLFSNCRQQTGCRSDLGSYVSGSRGSATLSERRRGLVVKNADGERAYDGPTANMYQVEHNELFASIRNGRPINNGEYMAKSTLMAIMGRMAAYTGQQVTWEQAMESRQDLTPARYDWDLQLPVPPVAVPGVTRFE
ncbi:MAG: Gfo/Idh/MocA family oxidoreductase [Gemmataceae bacterium]|nr:Gfo/Idh/MocA family oxidoreductase [Gemmataceae bacterium]